MVNASFVFGMDEDEPDVFDRTVEWAVAMGIETATFHILTPYPGTALHARMSGQKRMLHSNWDLYDTRHAVFQPARMTPETLEAGCQRAYRQFYSWRSIITGASIKPSLAHKLRHVAYAGGWKKFEPLWGIVICARQVTRMLPTFERILTGPAQTTPTSTRTENAGVSGSIAAQK